MKKNQEILATFTKEALPSLDVVVLGALELFSEVTVPAIDFTRFKRPLVVGSGNAAVTGKLLFDDVDAVFADESSYQNKLATIPTIDGAFLISASGSKHAVSIVKTLVEKKLPTLLLTNNETAPVKEFLPPESVFVFPKNREPYTYNTSTYLGMVLSKTKEDAAHIQSFIENEVATDIPTDLISYTAFYFIVPEAFSDVRDMFKTKFDELFGSKLMGRICTVEQTKHAKTVVENEHELFVSFGQDNDVFGLPHNRITIGLPQECDYAAMIAVGYYFIGHIQRQFPQYYNQNIERYVQETSEIFGSTIKSIVE